jgi:Uma2 family endonuclease
VSTQAPIERRRFTVTEYEWMAHTGTLGEDDRVELIDGEIVEMAPIGPPHSGTVKRLIGLFSATLGDRAVIGAQDPVRLSTRTEPEPDLVLARPRSDFYTLSHPVPDDVLLLVEVSDTSLVYDRDVKMPHYAEAGIAEVWIIDLNDGVLLVHRGPERSEYTEVQTLKPGDQISPLAFPDLTIELTQILGA